MISDINTLDFSKTYTFADYLTWQFQERVELIKGRIFKMSPAPSRLHQKVSGRIFYKIYNFLEDKSCEIYSAPFDVRFPNKDKDDKQIYTVVQPDICVVCDKNKLDDKGCIGAPDIIVEILSPSTSEKDLKSKYLLYEENQVKEYWVVFPQINLIEKYTFNEKGVYYLENKYTISDTLTSKTLPGFQVALEDLFEIE